MADYQVKTKHGYDFFEVSSAFQKSVRRCDEKNAMFWAVELYESGYAKYAWKRIVIMASEDVGLGEAIAISTIMALKESYDYLVGLKDKHKPEKLPFTHAVLVLTHSRKSRYIDLAISVYWDMVETTKLEVPDFAYDMHTRKGKAMGRGMDHFYKEGAFVNKANKLSNEEAMESLAQKIDSKHSSSHIKEDIPEPPQYKAGSLFPE